jgi:hypothetical protein
MSQAHERVRDIARMAYLQYQELQSIHASGVADTGRSDTDRKGVKRTDALSDGYLLTPRSYVRRRIFWQLCGTEMLEEFRLQQRQDTTCLKLYQPFNPKLLHRYTQTTGKLGNIECSAAIKCIRHAAHEPCMQRDRPAFSGVTVSNE